MTERGIAPESIADELEESARYERELARRQREEVADLEAKIARASARIARADLRAVELSAAANILREAGLRVWRNDDGSAEVRVDRILTEPQP